MLESLLFFVNIFGSFLIIFTFEKNKECDRRFRRMRYSTRLFVFNCQADKALYLAKDQGRDRVSINLE